MRGKGVSGTVTVAVSGEEYTITTNGVNKNDDNSPVRLFYKGTLEKGRLWE